MAIDAVAAISDGWRADEHELSVLDFKETPDTALPPDVRAKRNMGRARKAFFGTLAETSACLANTQGGTIVIGVRDRAATRAQALQGVDPTIYSPEAVRLAVYNGTSPSLTVDVQEHDADGQRLLLVNVPRGAVIHATSSGGYRWRVHDRCEPIQPDTMRAISAARGIYDWSAAPSSLGPEALSGAALAVAAERLRSIGQDDLADQAEDDRAQFLRSCDLLADGVVRNAAIVLYGSATALAATVPDWGLVLSSAPSAGSEGSVLLRREDARRRPLVLLVEDALARVAGVVVQDTFRVGAHEIRLVDYADDIVRELIANALAHRDWEQPGVIQVEHSPDSLTVSSPGDLLPTLHPDRLLRETAQRNRVLSREITRLRIAEGAGMGFDRVYRSLAAVGKQPPRIETGPRFSVIVPGGSGDRAFARFLQSPDFPAPRLAADLDVLLTLAVLRRRRSVTATSIAPALQREEDSAAAILQRMHDAGLLDPTRASAGRRQPSYQLSTVCLSALRTALTYRTGTIDVDDDKLLRHLKRHRRIANEDVRNYLDCDMATARNRLTRLRQKGYITFAPDGPRRGPHVEYIATGVIDTLEL